LIEERIKTGPEEEELSGIVLKKTMMGTRKQRGAKKSIVLTRNPFVSRRDHGRRAWTMKAQ
jgi:hypothetical protein